MWMKRNKTTTDTKVDSVALKVPKKSNPKVVAPPFLIMGREKSLAVEYGFRAACLLTNSRISKDRLSYFSSALASKATNTAPNVLFIYETGKHCPNNESLADSSLLVDGFYGKAEKVKPHVFSEAHFLSRISLDKESNVHLLPVDNLTQGENVAQKTQYTKAAMGVISKYFDHVVVVASYNQLSLFFASEEEKTKVHYLDSSIYTAPIRLVRNRNLELRFIKVIPDVRKLANERISDKVSNSMYTYLASAVDWRDLFYIKDKTRSLSPEALNNLKTAMVQDMVLKTPSNGYFSGGTPLYKAKTLSSAHNVTKLPVIPKAKAFVLGGAGAGLIGTMPILAETSMMMSPALAVFTGSAVVLSSKWTNKKPKEGANILAEALVSDLASEGHIVQLSSATNSPNSYSVTGNDLEVRSLEAGQAVPGSAANAGTTVSREKVILRRMAALIDKWMEYELNPLTLLEYPLMSDAACGLTSNFLFAFSTLVQTKEAYQDGDVDLGELEAKLEAAEKAFIVAENNAKKMRRSHLSLVEKKNWKKAKDLTAIALNSEASPNERANAWRKANDYLEGIMILPDKAVRGLLESSPA